MTVNRWATAQTMARNAVLLDAETMRSLATHEAQVEYSEAVRKLRERYELDVAEAAARLRAAVRPAHQAYNAAIIAAEYMLVRSAL